VVASRASEHAGSSVPRTLSAAVVASFRARVWAHWREHGRHDLPWRLTADPYAILVSEVMLQQTQVSRVLPKYTEWMDQFPTIDSLAAAPLEAVLRAWQGLGYNRRAVALKRASEIVSAERGGVLPRDATALVALPGIGPATAAGVMAFAYGEPVPYLETNVRGVYIHEFFGDAEKVPDRDILPLLETTLDEGDPRQWFYALLDYGWWLKRTQPNPTRRSAHYARQSAFEGSRRQKRSRLLRSVMARPGTTADGLACDLDLSFGETTSLLESLASEGFLRREDERWFVAE
jgi:A/G-specific adenine glycosylase